MKTTTTTLLIILFAINNIFSINAPVLSSPADNSGNVSTKKSLVCNTVNGITDYSKYTFEIDTVPTFDSPLLEVSTGTYGTSYNIYKQNNNFLYGKTYYWRVKVTDGTNTSNWSAVWSFTTLETIPLEAPSYNSTGEYTSRSLICGAEYSNSSYSNYEFEVDTTPDFNSAMLIHTNGDYSNSSYIYMYNDDLHYGTKYYWRARVHNDVDTSNWSAVWNFTTLETIPLEAPSYNSTDEYTSRSLICGAEYNNSSYSNYEFEVDTTPDFNSAMLIHTNGDYSNSSYIYMYNDDLHYGTKYYWRARVHNDVDTSNWSAVWSFTTLYSITLSYPYNTASDISVSQSVICNTEYNNTSYTNYEFELDTTPNFNSPLLQHTAGDNYSNSSIYKYNNNLRYGQDYYWRARVHNDTDTSEWSVIWTFKTEYELTTAPNLTAPVNNSTDIAYASVIIDWESISNADSYQYQVSTTSDFTAIVVDGNTSLTDRTITNLTPNTIYYWRVRGENVNGYSPWSEVWNFTTETAEMTPPDLISPANNSTDMPYSSIDFSWGSTFGASEYIFEISQDNTFNAGVTTINTSNTTYTISGLNGNTQYFWRVASTDGNTTSAWSEIWNFTTQNIPTQISDLDTDEMLVYPNPAANVLYVKNLAPNTDVRVLDVSGKIIINAKYNDTKGIDLSLLHKGIYFVKINDKAYKFVKL